MPIPINLLAEAQSAEDLSRRDPVRRGIWMGGFLVFVMLIWVVKIQIDVWYENTSLHRLEFEWRLKEPRHKKVVENQIAVADLELKLAALDRLATNRYLWGNLLNALQQATIENIQLTKLRGEQSYSQVAAVEGKTLGSKVIPRQPAVVVERMSLFLEARDWNPGEQTYNKFKETLSNYDFFKKRLQKGDSFVFEGTLSQPMQDAREPERQFITFNLSARFPEVRRSE